MSLTLYFSPFSPPSRSVRTLLLLSKLPFQEKIIDMQKGEHKSPDYERINPNQSLPAIVDGGLKLFESHAILKYVALKKGLDQYYPKNVQSRAKVDCYLDWSSTGMEAIGKYVNQCFLFPMLMKTAPPSNQQELFQDADETIKFFETFFLKGNYIQNQPSMTLADIKATADLTTMLITGYDFNQHPRLRDYLQRMLAQPEFKTAYQEYLQMVGHMPLNDSIKYIISGVDPNESWKIKLYYHPWSSPSRCARTVLMITGVHYTEKVINLQKGDQSSPEYSLINPNQTVPAIQDGQLSVFESGAIMRYVAAKYNMCNFYPADAQGRARVDQFCDFFLTEMDSLAKYVFSCFVAPMLFKAPIPADKDQQLKDLTSTMEFFSRVFLQDGRWDYINNQPSITLADIKAGCYFSQLFISDFKFESIKGLENYMRRVFQLPEMQRSHAEFFQFLSGQKVTPFAQSMIRPQQIKPTEKITLYFNFISPPGKAAKSLLCVAQIPFEEKVIDVQGGENAKAPYTNINPNQSIPALSCGAFNLFESHAIMRFVCIKFNLTQYYPNYPLRAKIDSYLDYHHTGVRYATSYVMDFFFGPKFMKKQMPTNKAERLIEVAEGLQFFVNVFLDGGKYKYIMGSNTMTIADLSFIAETAGLFFVDFDFSPFPVLKDYLRNMFNYRQIREVYSKFFLMIRFVAPSMNPYIASIVKGTEEGQSSCCSLI